MQKSWLHFFWARHQHYRHLQRAFTVSPHQDLLNTLKKDGIVVLDNFFPQEMVEPIANETFQLIEAVRQGQGDCYQNGGLLLIEEADQKLHSSAIFYEDPLINSVAKAYVSPEVVSFRRMVRYKEGTGHREHEDFQIFHHFDTWKLRFKAFLYLTDVGKDQAPLIYLQGSHRGGWRRKKEYEYFRYYNPSSPLGYPLNRENLYLGCFWPHQIKTLKHKYGFTDLICTGKAGTVILFDARGLHQGPLLHQGHRLVLTNHFNA